MHKSRRFWHTKRRAEATTFYDSRGTIDLNALNNSLLLCSVVSEVPHLCGASASMLVTTAPTPIRGKMIPAKTRIMVPTRQLHLNSTVFGA
jgi:hypothetical protein